jgi:hypothetical protein
MVSQVKLICFLCSFGTYVKIQSVTDYEIFIIETRAEINLLV